jgi:hypothetical protein
MPPPLSASDTPAHPGVKTGHASTTPQYGDEPGDMLVTPTPALGGGRRHASETGQGSAADPEDRSRLHSQYTAHSAVLDTLGSVHGDGSTGGSDAQGLGLALRPLTSAERQAFAVDSGGLVVTGVTPGVGMRAGFHLGDVVLMLDGVDVTSTDQFYKLAQQLPHDRPVPVLVRRPGSNLFLPLGAPAHR